MEGEQEAKPRAEDLLSLAGGIECPARRPREDLRGEEEEG